MLLIDTNGIIEAVRTGCWNALTGQLDVETVQKCQREARTGNQNLGNITVPEEALERLYEVHRVSPEQRAKLELEHPGAGGLDAGERDLLAHAHDLPNDEAFRLCSPDIACVRVASKMGLAEQLCSLERLAEEVGQRPHPPLRDHFSRRWLGEKRTRFRSP